MMILAFKQEESNGSYLGLCKEIILNTMLYGTETRLSSSDVLNLMLIWIVKEDLGVKWFLRVDNTLLCNIRLVSRHCQFVVDCLGQEVLLVGFRPTTLKSQIPACTPNELQSLTLPGTIFIWRSYYLLDTQPITDLVAPVLLTIPSLELFTESHNVIVFAFMPQ